MMAREGSELVPRPPSHGQSECQSQYASCGDDERGWLSCR
uniref:Uncharacterized protein n=1 Tax=Arundo donax TaxID=35708 RepID=A0A0A8YVD0_ARUDO